MLAKVPAGASRQKSVLFSSLIALTTIKITGKFMDKTMKIIKKPLMLVALALVLPVGLVFAGEGAINVASQHSAEATMDKFEDILTSKGMTVFARINHQQGAANVGINLRATELIIFGNPKVGSPLMQCTQTIALDLPQKALVWTDEAGKVWLTYNDPEYLRSRHQVEGCDEVFAKVTKALAGLTKAATE